WHQDLKPQNILLRSRGSGTILECDFIITDFGLSHFRRRGHGNRNARDTDTKGTHMYGAPETFRYKEIEGLPLQVESKVDVWSLGCIFSEVATWIIHDWRRVLEYRRQRKTQAAEKLGCDTGEIFHDAQSVLPAIKECHIDIVKSKRHDDVITEKVLQDLVEKMLVQEGQRPDVHTLLKTANLIIEAAKHELQKAILEEDPLAQSSTSMENSRGPARRLNNSHDIEPPQNPSITQSHVPTLSPHQPVYSGVQEMTVRWPLKDALMWKESKSRLRQVELPHKETLKQLQSMRHVFLIDNTATMSNYTAELEKLVGVLAYIAKRSNPDEIHMFFTTSKEKVLRSKTTKKLLHCLKKVHFGGTSNMALELDHHLSSFEQYRVAATRVLSSSNYKERDKRLNVYVLTDGNWNGQVVEENICRMVQNLQHQQVPQYHVGIQFIRFGDDPAAIKRLARLDHLNRRFKLSLDIVDTTPANGCVLKMLLGGIDKKFDADEGTTAD
ncbi:MAG: hypothetical protein Q9214_006502, partial [Letrouitia sp. 1 TL-2023]